jgi:hypothetical protein
MQPESPMPSQLLVQDFHTTFYECRAQQNCITFCEPACHAPKKRHGLCFCLSKHRTVSRHMTLRYMLGMRPQLHYQCPLKAAEAHEKPIKVKSLAQSPYQTPCLDRWYPSMLGIDLLLPIADARMCGYSRSSVLYLL